MAYQFPAKPWTTNQLTPDGKYQFDGARWRPLFSADVILADQAGSVTLPAAGTATKIAALLQSVRNNIKQLFGQTREKLSAPRTYYVRTDGNDSNTGLVNTAAAAFRTVQKAVDLAASLDLGAFDVTVRCTGSFAESLLLRPLTTSGGKIAIRGNASNVTDFILNPTGAPCVDTGRGFSGAYDFSYLKFASLSGCIRGFGGGGAITYGNVDFGQSNIEHVLSPQGCIIVAVASYQISGGASAHVASYDAGHIRVQNVTVTLVGNPTFGTAFALAERGGTVLVTGAGFSGTAIGKRYATTTAGGVLTGNAGPNYLPGNADGFATAPGWYA